MINTPNDTNDTMKTTQKTDEKPAAKKLPPVPLTDAQKATVGRLQAAQQRLKMNDDQFAAGVCASTTWYRIRNDKYVAPADEWLEKLATNAKLLLRHRAAAAKQADMSFIETPEFKTLRKAIKEAFANMINEKQDRLIIFEAPTGCGKTTNAKRLLTEFPGVLITAQSSWRNSYRFALEDIAEKLGIAEAGKNIHKAILAHLSKAPQVLYFEELDIFTTSPKLVNFFKELVNETRSIVCLFMTPECNAKIFAKAGETGLQTKTRTLIKVKAERPTMELISEYLTAHCGIFADLKKAAKMLFEATDLQRGLHCISRVTGNCLDEIHETENDVTLELFERKLKAYNAVKA